MDIAGQNLAQKSFPLRNPIEEAGAIVVLGAAVRQAGEPSPALRRRVHHAVELMRQGKSQVLLVTGGLGKHPPTEAEVMHQLAIAQGIPAERIIMEKEATSTFESVVLCTRIMRRHGWSTAIVVSDPYHLFRTVITFRAFGIRATGSAAEGGRQRNPLWIWLYYYLREAVALPWYLLLVLVEKLRHKIQAKP